MDPNRLVHLVLLFLLYYLDLNLLAHLPLHSVMSGLFSIAFILYSVLSFAPPPAPGPAGMTYTYIILPFSHVSLLGAAHGTYHVASLAGTPCYCGMIIRDTKFFSYPTMVPS